MKATWLCTGLFVQSVGRGKKKKKKYRKNTWILFSQTIYRLTSKCEPPVPDHCEPSPNIREVAAGLAVVPVECWHSVPLAVSSLERSRKKTVWGCDIGQCIGDRDVQKGKGKFFHLVSNRNVISTLTAGIGFADNFGQTALTVIFSVNHKNMSAS